MSDTPFQLEATLLSQQKSLRTLAWSLIGDEHAAEDVLQETWLAATFRSPSERGSKAGPGAWLQKVTRNLARNRRRAERSRSHHERHASRAEALPDMEQAMAEREVVRKLIDAVAKLNEPYQSIIIMRYYQDLAPRFIAEERGLPLATVKSQLNRGLNQLRETLDKEFADDRNQWAGVLTQSLAAVQSLARSPILGANGLGAWLLAAVGVLSASVWLAGGFGGALNEPAREPASVGANAIVGTGPAQGAAAGDEGAVQVSDQESNSRTAFRTGETPLAAAWPVAPYGFSISVQVVQQEDRPVTGAQILLAPTGSPMNSVGKTPSDGLLEVHWRGFEPLAKMTLGVSREGQLQTALREIELRAGEPMSLRIPTGYPSVFDLHGMSEVLTLEALGYLSGESAKRMPHLDDMTIQAHVLEAERDAGSGEIRFVRFSTSDLPEDNASTMDTLVGLGYMGGLSKSLAKPKLTRELQRVLGQVTQATGKPAVGAQIYLVHGKRNSEVRTDELGRFELSFPSLAKFEIHAGGGDFGQASKLFEFEEGLRPGIIEWNPALERGNEVSGQVIQAAEALDGHWCVDLEIVQGAQFYGDLCSADNGSFALPNLPNGPARLILSGPPAWPFATAVRSLHSPSALDEEIQLEGTAAQGVLIEVRVRTAAGAPRASEVQLWQLASGRGLWLNYDEALGCHRREATPPGSYRVRVLDSEAGFVDVGEIHVGSGEPVLVGPIALPLPGGLQVSPTDPAPGSEADWSWSLRQRSAGIETIFGQQLAPGSANMELPAGDYLLSLAGPEWVMPAMHVSIESGKLRELGIEPELMGEVLVLGSTPKAPALESVGFRILDETGGRTLHSGSMQVAQGTCFQLPAGKYVFESQGTQRALVVLSQQRVVL